METYTELKPFIENPKYQMQRQNTLSTLADDMVDPPIVDLINRINKLPYCFTLQSCYGHFLYEGQKDLHNLEPLPDNDTISSVEYRIAYIAFCIENNSSGRGLFTACKEITVIDPENIQFCCAEWFWKRQINSFVLQVEPDRFKRWDKAILDYNEALKVEKIRDKFFVQLHTLL